MPGTAARDKIHLAEAPLPFRTLLGAMRFVGISEKKETRKIPVFSVAYGYRVNPIRRTALAVGAAFALNGTFENGDYKEIGKAHCFDT